MAISITQIIPELLKECPELQPQWDEYSACMKERASDADFFSGAWLCLRIQNFGAKGDTNFFAPFFGFLERLITEGDDELKALATEGFLKGLHKSNSFSIKPGPEAFAVWMGPKATQYWQQLCEAKAADDRLKDAEEEDARLHSVVFRLRPARLWGDYGSILMTGLASRDKESGNLILDRAGPFAPPIFFPTVFPSGRCAVITQSFRELLEDAGLGQLAFRSIIKHNIIDIPWHTWDRLAKFPSVIPESGEPEEFILDRENSDEASQEMGELWELQTPGIPCEIAREESEGSSSSSLKRFVVKPASGNYQGLFSPIKNPHMWLVDEPARLLFEQHAGEWVQFDYVSAVH